jgi:hypothetical protein
MMQPWMRTWRKGQGRHDLAWNATICNPALRISKSNNELWTFPLREHLTNGEIDSHEVWETEPP